jgi:hypothetical protein
LGGRQAGRKAHRCAFFDHPERLDVVARLIAILWWSEYADNFVDHDDKPINLTTDLLDPIGEKVRKIGARWREAANAIAEAQKLVRRAEAERAELPKRRRRR